MSNDAIVSGADCDARHRATSTLVSVHCSMVTTSVKPGTASPSGTPSQIGSGGALVVVVDGRVVVDDSVSPGPVVDVLLAAARASSASVSSGSGDLINQPKAKAATTIPTTPMVFNRPP